MPNPPTINVSFFNQFRTVSGDVTVEGDSDELFVTATARAIREQLAPDYSGRPAVIWWKDPNYPELLSMVIPRGMTMAAAQEYFGDEADATPPTVGVNEGGYGGDADAANYIIELVRGGFEVGGYVTATLAAQRLAMKVRYGHARQLAKDWNDGDYVSPELRSVVQAKSIWQRRDFDKVFGLDSSRGPLLLRTLGFQRYDMDWGEEWHRMHDE